MKPILALALVLCSFAVADTIRRYEIVVDGNVKIAITFPGGPNSFYTRAAQIQALKDGIKLLESLDSPTK